MLVGANVALVGSVQAASIGRTLARIINAGHRSSTVADT